MARRAERALHRRSVISQQPWWESAPVERRRLIAEHVAEAAQVAGRNRDLVLAHADLARQLVRRLGYERPDQWSGYVPPRFYEAGGPAWPRWYPNESPVRAVLVELVAEAQARAVAP